MSLGTKSIEKRHQTTIPNSFLPADKHKRLGCRNHRFPLSVIVLSFVFMRSENRKVVIVDWDDTILPSTFVDRWQIESYRGLPVHVSFFSGSRYW